MTDNKSKKTTTLKSTSSLSTQYDIDNGESFTLAAVPAKESFNTTFSLLYWTDGSKDEKAEVFA